jgi:cobalt-precorrin-5B (C1)-methyltransferase
MDEYIVKDNKKLRFGYTTGSCAAAASKAATYMLLYQRKIDTISLMTPKGIMLHLEVLEGTFDKDRAYCGIKKDSGDDPDVTNEILVYALVEKTKEQGIVLDGGIGVGRVTKKGLEQEIGEPAINKVPRKMIKDAIEEMLEECDYPFGIKVTISIPDGVEIAKKTFNPRLGIVGGISILGTTGIVEPMSEDSIRETIHLEIRMQAAAGRKYLLVTPGNYGEDFAKEVLHLSLDKSIKCSNYIGDTIDYAVMEGMEGMLLIGHIGKPIKLAGGIMNTHSKHGDGRMEILTAYTLLAGGENSLLNQIMSSNTTEEALEYIKHSGLLDKTMSLIMNKIQYHMNKRSYDNLKIGVITFSNQLGLLGKTESVEDMIWYIS